MNNELYSKNLDASYIFELNFFYRKKYYRVVYDVQAKFYTVFVGREPEGIKNDIDGGATFWPIELQTMLNSVKAFVD